MSRYGKSQFAFATVGDSEIAEAVNDSNEQLLLIVVSVVMIDDIGELAEVADIELELPLDIVMFKLVIVVVLCVVGAVVTVDTGVIVVGVVKRSLLLNGSNDDCDDKLNTEPQSIVLVLPLSIPSTSTPNDVSVLLTKGLVAGAMGVWVLFGGGFEGNGVALPDDGSFNGWFSYVIGSLNVVTRFVG